MEQANHGHQRAYGDDEWTARASDHFRQLFETDCEVFFAFNGTAANSLALSSLCQSYHSVICSETAHVETDECGAPEFFSSGAKLTPLNGAHGKITADAVAAQLARDTRGVHHSQPMAVSISQSTEAGTCYTPDEAAAIGAVVRSHGLKFHMDGARFANALASLGCTPAEVCQQHPE